MRETVRKCARTFSNVLALMDADPDFVFACSSAQQYAWMKEFYPELFERIREKVAAGQFVPVGGMWVESDTNMPGARGDGPADGGRQAVLPRGVRRRDAGRLAPRLLRLLGRPPADRARRRARSWFLSQKLSWNDTDRMPHHTFTLGGHRRLPGAHALPAGRHVQLATCPPRSCCTPRRTSTRRASPASSLVPFGWGDGGGGPTREMIASARRFANLEGAPTRRAGQPEHVLRARRGARSPHPPVWSGEMYLELHRGTYTSQARTKQGNRRTEHLLREAELWAATAAVQHGAEYPYDELERIWHTVLLHQFHDILPGQLDRLGAPPGRGDLRRDRRRAARRLIAASTAAVVGDGDTAAAAQRRAAQPRRRAGPRGRAGRGAGRRPRRADPRSSDGTVRVRNGLIDVAPDDRRPDRLAASTWRRTARSIPAGALANLLQLHRDTPASGTRGTSTRSTAGSGTDLLDADSREVVTETADVVVVRTTSARSARRTLVQDLTFRRGQRGDRDRHRHRLARAAEAAQARVPARRARRPVRGRDPVRARVPRRRTPTRRGTRRGSRSARTAGCTSASPGYGVAIANDSTYGHDVTRREGGTGTTVRLSLLRAPAVPRPGGGPGPPPARPRCCTRAPTSRTPIQDGYRTNLPARVVRGAGPVEPLVTSSTTRPWWSSR